MRMLVVERWFWFLNHIRDKAGPDQLFIPEMVRKHDHVLIVFLYACDFLYRNKYNYVCWNITYHVNLIFENET